MLEKNSGLRQNTSLFNVFLRFNAFNASPLMKKLLFASLCAAIWNAAAQGTVDFNNLREWMRIGIPASGPCEETMWLGSEFTAQLQLADGTPVGKPVKFLDHPITGEGTGFFVGGVRVIEGVPGPGPVHLQFFVTNEDGSLYGTQDAYNQTLGGHGVPPATPPALRLTIFTSPPNESPNFVWGLQILPEEDETTPETHQLVRRAYHCFRYEVEISSDLQNWTQWKVLQTDSEKATVPLLPGRERLFYRVRQHYFQK